LLETTPLKVTKKQLESIVLSHTIGKQVLELLDEEW